MGEAVGRRAAAKGTRPTNSPAGRPEVPCLACRLEESAAIWGSNHRFTTRMVCKMPAAHAATSLGNIKRLMGTFSHSEKRASKSLSVTVGRRALWKKTWVFVGMRRLGLLETSR